LSTLTATGNLLLGTTTDSGNGKLQLATHTTSAGGIGFGTDVSLYRNAANQVSFIGGGAAPIGFALSSGNPYIFGGTSASFIRFNSSGQLDLVTATATSLTLQTNYTTALTLDSSQNATFAGTINVNGTATSTVKGTIVSDVNTNTIPSFRSKDTINSGDSWRFGIGTTVDNQTFGFYDETTSTAVLSLGRTGNASLAGTIATQGGTASTPANAFATGTAGTIRWDASYIYVCTAANTWKRAAIAAW